MLTEKKKKKKKKGKNIIGGRAWRISGSVIIRRDEGAS